MANDMHRGARVGPRVANLLSQAIVATHNGLLHVKHKLAVMVFNTISNEISDEVDTAIGPLIRRLAADYEADGPAAAYLKFMGYGRGQLKALAGSGVAASSIAWAIGTILNNEFAPNVYAALRFNPNMIPDPSTVASIAAVGAIADGDAIGSIAANGFSAKWGEGLLEIARTYPAVTDLLDMLRRGSISQEQFIELAHKNGVPANVAEVWSDLKRQFISMQDAAVAYLRGAIPREEVYGFGQFEGLENSDVDVYLASIGEPPGTMEMLEAYRRGLISRGQLEEGIKQSRVRNEWIPMLEALRFSPISISDAVNAAVQNHLDYGAAASIAEQNGLQPGAFDTLYQTAGSPLSRTELNDLYNRGLIGSETVLQGLRESRLKDKYGADAFELRRRLLEPRTVSEAVFHGVMPHNTAVRKVMEHGFNAEDAATIVDAASSRKTQGFRDRIVSAAETLYVDNAITREEMMSVVTAMGYTETEAEFAVQASEYHREARVFSAATNAIRAKLIAHHVTPQDASNLLDGIGMRATQRDYLLKYWEVEAAANTRVLTPAQTIKAVALGLITEDQGTARLQGMGYSAEDAGLLMGGA